jgi:SAM-dependent methyltransferase
MDPFTRRQLHALSIAFYTERAEDFDASRVELPWPGWDRVAALLPEDPLRVLDVGCGNGRLAADLHARDLELVRYVGIDASAALLDAARARVGPLLGERARWVEHDFLATQPAGAGLPPGPFELVALMGVLHHVPGGETRTALLQSAAERLAEGGLLAVTVWQFAGRERFERRRVDWSAVGPVLGAPIDPAALEPGDGLLRFGSDPGGAPRYCHQVSDAELAEWPARTGLETVSDFRADGAEGDLNRYWIARRTK